MLHVRPPPPPLPVHTPAATHNNLFTNIDTGLGLRPFISGGDDDRGAQSGARRAVWRGLVPGSRRVRPRATACSLNLHAAPASPCAGANTTFWGIYASATTKFLPLPSCYFGPLLNFVGKWSSTVQDGRCADETGWTVDQIGRSRRLVPLDLFQAQRTYHGLQNSDAVYLNQPIWGG